MDIHKARALFSTERFNTYEKIAQQYGKDPVELYLLNAQVSASFHFPLHICEIMLRNSIDYAISAVLTNDWHTNLRFQHMLDQYYRGKLIDSINKNANSKGYTPKGKVIAELTLGFWVNLLSNKYAHIWTHNFYSCFINYKVSHPLSTNPVNALNALHNQLKTLNNFRNRIAHYEPIVNNNLLAEYARILNIIEYIDTNCAKWVQAKQQAECHIKCINDYMM
jgi:hypothetical protein